MSPNAGRRHKARTALHPGGLDPDYYETDIRGNHSCRDLARGTPGGRIDPELERQTRPSVANARIPTGSSRLRRRTAIQLHSRTEIEQPAEIFGFWWKKANYLLTRGDPPLVCPSRRASGWESVRG